MTHNDYDIRDATRRVKEAAFAAGFDKVGIVRAEALTNEGAKLKEWLRLGYHATMAWMEREPDKRADPTRLLEGARSVISVALNYFTPKEHASEPGTGKVSRYAWGDDYHDVVRERLEDLAARISAILPGVRCRLCVDTSPILDKAWAVRAGVGWLGKHTNVITQEMGSWVFLGEVIIDRELEFDEPAEDHCGSCTACLDACPTGAIVEAYLVDSNKCISFVTIELRSDEIPSAVKPDLEGWLYGCDICQDVCPWNRFEQETSEKRFEPRAGNAARDLRELLEMDHEDYVEAFRNSAMKRAKLAGLQRNAKALLGDVS